VPGSTIDVQYHLAPEIIQTANMGLPMMVAIGIVLALIYFTLYRGFYRKLPASLRTETKELAWRDLRWPGCMVRDQCGDRIDTDPMRQSVTARRETTIRIK
jgi:hypothetical protein